MVQRNLSRLALSLIAAALLAACGGSQLPNRAPGTVPQASAPTPPGSSTNYKVVYSFRGGSDGEKPFAGLLYMGGKLYGTTVGGGTYSSDSPCWKYGYFGCGTVFSVTLDGAEKVLYTFGGGSDGAEPFAGLTEVGHTLYGTTSAGGSACYGTSFYLNCGTVFSVTLRGAEKMLHSFFGPSGDGRVPYADLTDVKGTLYGTTSLGGSARCWYSYNSNYACGTVFSITTAGTEGVVHSFGGAKRDGGLPHAGLIDVNGTLYGTTTRGGKHGRQGTVFSITLGGTEKVLHSFAGYPNDGSNPVASLIELNGKLYGTTTSGGAYSHGTVFSITTSGKEKVLYSFGESSTDGAAPRASLIKLNDKLYGTTSAGPGYGSGTIFSITTNGVEEVLHNFGSASDGKTPMASLIDVKGTLYGTTANGGANGCGTVFALTP